MVNRVDRVIVGESKSKIDRVWDAFWSEGISNPPEVTHKTIGEDVLPFLRSMGVDGSTYGEHMCDARFTVPTPAHLTGEKLRTLPVTVPPTDLQHEFACRVAVVER